MPNQALSTEKMLQILKTFFTLNQKHAVNVIQRLTHRQCCYVKQNLMARACTKLKDTNYIKV
jgi:hypothetical protein